ncbi:lysylphosphatidylglycerol synthase transmembrane domain-containing protein [Phycisphaerales bacterium AB-hyl4]|uniref:Lysylphosphatidylglycerol synthase transmembrane domain-containing protein n=1 Tax=Natronomicrosphaera hydrolytica TaxID=3242702 RepID=A0ABV4U1D1_9BACT
MTLASTKPSPTVSVSASPAAPEASRPRRVGFSLLLRLAISVGLLAILLSQVDLTGIFAVASGARFDLLAVLLAMFIAERCLGACRWHLLMRTQRVPVSFATTLRATLLGGFVGTFLPGGVGVEAVRVAAMTRAANLASATSSVLVDRILGSLALVGIVLVALALTPQPVPAAVPIAAWASLACLLALSLILLHPRLRRGLQWLLPGRRRGQLRRELRRFAASVRQMRRQPMTLAYVGGLSVLFQLLRVGIAPVAALALGLHIPLGLLLIYVPIIMFIMMMPISIAGLGVREAAFVYFFGLQYVTPEQALALSLLIGLFTLIVQLPGAVVCITGVRPRNAICPPTWQAEPTTTQEQN